MIRLDLNLMGESERRLDLFSRRSIGLPRMQRSERRQISDQANNCFFKSIAFLSRCHFHTSPFLLSPNGSSHPLLNKRFFYFLSYSPHQTSYYLAGNQGLRYFPYTGYLGLTPIRVEGGEPFLSFSHPCLIPSVVRTKLDADGKLLHAKSLAISIRCYESRVGRVNTLQSKILVDYTQVLWSKPAGVDYEQVGNLEYPFRFTIPAKVAGFSTAVFVDYRCMWRVEAGTCIRFTLESINRAASKY